MACKRKGVIVGRKKRLREVVTFSRRLDREIVERFKAFTDTLTPRVSDTAALEAAMVEYMERHGKKKGGEK